MNHSKFSHRCLPVLAILLLSLLVTTSLFATNGYFSHGYGLKYKGLAGAGVAFPMSSMAAALNPGSMVFVGSRYDFDLALFNPNRQYTVTGNPSQAPGTFGLAPGTIESGSRAFVIPAIGLNWMLGDNDNYSVGVTLYGNGGMNTNYETNTFGGSSPTGVDLAQFFVAPTFAIKVAERHGFGLTPILAYQRFKCSGLEAFGNFSSDANSLTNKGYDNSFGFGARVGYYGELMDFISVGASYQTKMLMSEFDNHAGLFAQQGDFDIPSNWTLGVALGYEAMALVFDVQRIMYSEIDAVGNPLLPNLMNAPLGLEEAAGFGWQDMTIFKIGAQFQTGGDWTWRAGFSAGDQPIPESETLFNILAPGVMQQHVTFGFTKKLGEKEVDFVITRALSESVSGGNPLEVPGQQTIELKMDQWEFGVGFSF